jgi:hypothetical protein
MLFDFEAWADRVLSKRVSIGQFLLITYMLLIIAGGAYGFYQAFFGSDSSHATLKVRR